MKERQRLEKETKEEGGKVPFHKLFDKQLAYYAANAD